MTLGLAACSSDEEVVAPEGGLTGNENVYMTLNLSYPQSRTATGETTEEVGTPEENKVRDVKLYLVGANGTEVEGQAVQQTTDNANYTATFESKKLVALAGQEVKVYVVANRQAHINDLNNLVSDVKNGNLFLMSNAEVQADGTGLLTMPSAEDLNSKHGTKETAVKLGTIKVERLAARMDYKQAKENNLYAFEGAEVDVTLKEMALLNVAKQQYEFRRVSEEGTAGSATTLLGAETPTNYVYDFDWANKCNASATAPDYKMPMTEHVKSKSTVGEYMSLANGNITDYKAMSYTMENTLPKVTQKDQMLYRDPTTVVFRGVLTPSATCTQELKDVLNGKTLEGTTQTHPEVFCYQNVVYGTWEQTIKAAETSKNEDFKNAVLCVNAKEGDANKKTAVEAGFTTYTWNDALQGYSVYYYFQNIHNQNAELTAPMRYGVVRNNVYKLQVTKIAKYGHPEDNGKDPDPIVPDKPVNPNDVYFQVGVQVLPWVVRVNDIEF